MCKGWGGGRPEIRGAPGQGEPRTQPAAGAVASAAQRSRGLPHPIALTLAGQGRAVTQRRVGAAGRMQGTGRADSGLEPGRRLGGCRRRTRQGSSFHIHTTRAHAKPPLPLSGPTAVLPLPRSRRYLWGSRLVAASRAGVPLPLPLPLGRWLRLGAGPGLGAGPPRRGRGRPGSSPRREAPRAGTGGQALVRLARSPSTQIEPGPVPRAVAPPASAEKRRKVYLPSRPTGRVTAGLLVFSSPLPSARTRTQQVPRNSDYEHLLSTGPCSPHALILKTP